MKTEPITVDLLLSEMERLRKKATGNQGGMTTRQASEALGVPMPRARDLIRQGVKQGTLTCRRVLVPNMTGDLQAMPMYFPVQKVAKGK